MKRVALGLIGALIANPLAAAPMERAVRVEGVAPLRDGDITRARQQALGDALRRALMAGGMDVSASTAVDRGVVRSDTLWATANARISGFEITDEWQDGGLYHLSVAANLVRGDEKKRCDASSTAVTVGAPLADIDPAVDPAIAGPLQAQLITAVHKGFSSSRDDFVREGAPPPPALLRTSSSDYAARAYGTTQSGFYLRPFVTLERRTLSAPLLVRGQVLLGTFGVEVIDAAEGRIVGTAVRQARWMLSAKAWEYAPAELRPPRISIAPKVMALLDDMVEEARSLTRCAPVNYRVTGGSGDELILAAGIESGLKQGDILSVGSPTADMAGSSGWGLAEVVSTGAGISRAKLLDTDSRGIRPTLATRLR